MTPISKNGVYDVPIDIYHSQACCDGPSISSTGLRIIEKECPARYWAFSDLNPAPFERKKSEALNFGKAAHALMLGEPEFEKYFKVSPHEVFNKNPGKAWHDDWKAAVEATVESRQLIRPSEMVAVKAMVSAQLANPDVARAFVEGEPEKSILWKDEETGVWLKARPDWMPHKPAERLVTEYKTTVTLEPRKLDAAVFKYGYEMQAALCVDGIEAVSGWKPMGMAHVVQEKDPPYLVELKLFTPDQIDYGRKEYRNALRTFAECFNSGFWPGWTQGPSYFDTPYYIAKAMENFDARRSTPADPYGPGDYLAAG